MPNGVQIQMTEGVGIIDEAISFLRTLEPLQALEMDPNLTKSALYHVEDIGPKGLLQYQSSDDTQPQERIERFGNYINSLGENIDFGPNDAIGVIISLTIDDGEEGRPHRENLFSQEYKKIGIACGSHTSEYDMCVMDFAYDFVPLDYNKEEYRNDNKNVSMYNEPVVNLNLVDTIEPNNKTQMYTNNQFNLNNNIRNNGVNYNRTNNTNQSPVVKLSLDNDNFKNNLKDVNQNFPYQNKTNNVNNNGADSNPFNNARINMINEIAKKRLIKKIVSITTKISYVYENGSTKTEEEVKNHTFEY